MRRASFLAIIVLAVAVLGADAAQNLSNPDTSSVDPVRGPSSGAKTIGLEPDETTKGFLANVERNLRILRSLKRQGDIEVRSLGLPKSPATTRVTAQLHKLESRLAWAERTWRNLKTSGGPDSDLRFERRMRLLSEESGHLITAARQALQVDLTVQQGIASLSPRLNRGAPSFTGGISGTITLEGVGTPLPAIAVLVFDDGNSYITEGMTDGSGVYEVSDLADGSYFLKTYNYSGHIDELYDDIECAGGGGWGLCDHLSGTPVVVTGGLVTSGINFQLVVGGTISGNVTEDVGGADIDFLRVDIYSSTGDWMSFGLTESDGNYLGQQGLPSGTYYAMTDSGNTGLHYQDEIYDDITCGLDCDPTTGDAIAVTVGVATPGINFALVDGGWISGTITDHSTGLPIEEAGISFYTASGDWFADGYADSNGDYTSRGGLPTGDYYAHSFNWAGYADELYDDFDCSFGCDVTTGTPVGVTLGIETPGIDFALVLIEIFFDGFESGDTSAWSNTKP